MTVRKKVAFYFNSLLPSGGIERVTSNLVNNLFNDDIEIEILVKDEARSFYPINPQVKIRSLNTNLSLLSRSRLKRILYVAKSCFLMPFLLRKAFAQNHYDVIVISHPLNLVEVLLSGKVHLSQIIATEHGAPDGYNLIYKIIKAILYKRTPVYIVPTKSDVEYYLQRKFPAYYLPHLKTELNYSKANLKSKQILNIGRLTSDKQQLLLLEIWKKLHIKYPDWKLKIIGAGELESEIKDFIISNNLLSSVTLIPPKSKIEEEYRDASIFCLTSKFEGFGMVLLESIGFGVPCVAFDCPSGPRDIIQDGETGFLVKPFDLKSFEQKLELLMSDSAILSSMSIKALDFSKSWDNQNIINIWQNIISMVTKSNKGKA